MGVGVDGWQGEVAEVRGGGEGSGKKKNLFPFVRQLILKISLGNPVPVYNILKTFSMLVTAVAVFPGISQFPQFFSVRLPRIRGTAPREARDPGIFRRGNFYRPFFADESE